MPHVRLPSSGQVAANLERARTTTRRLSTDPEAENESAAHSRRRHRKGVETHSEAPAAPPPREITHEIRLPPTSVNEAPGVIGIRSPPPKGGNRPGISSPPPKGWDPVHNPIHHPIHHPIHTSSSAELHKSLRSLGTNIVRMAREQVHHAYIHTGTYTDTHTDTYTVHVCMHTSIHSTHVHIHRTGCSGAGMAATCICTCSHAHMLRLLRLLTCCTCSRSRYGGHMHMHMLTCSHAHMLASSLAPSAHLLLPLALGQPRNTLSLVSAPQKLLSATRVIVPRLAQHVSPARLLTSMVNELNQVSAYACCCIHAYVLPSRLQPQPYPSPSP